MGASLLSEPILVITPSVPAHSNGDRIFLDDKAVSGLRHYANLWPGSVRSIFRHGPPSAVAFGRWHHRGDLPFNVEIIGEGRAVPEALIRDAAVILAAGDNHLDLSLANQGAKFNIPVCFIIEYVLGTRIKILFLTKQPLFRKLMSLLWMLRIERERRKAFSVAKFIQCNGTPAGEAYRRYVDNSMIFFDTRLSSEQMATSAETQQKVERLRRGAPLRLVYTGRLERMKGADHLIEVARQIEIPYSLDIYGSGELENSLKDCIARYSLHGKVTLHRPLDFESALIPKLKSAADIFLCCHVQSDPSCTYLETLGCAVPIVGYANDAWAGITKRADVGWQVPVGNARQMAETIAALDMSRAEIADKMEKAVTFAKKHSCEEEFRRRIDQLINMSSRATSVPTTTNG